MNIQTIKTADRLLTVRDLEARWAVGTTTRCAIMKEKNFPDPICLPGMGSLRNKRWRLADIEAFEAENQKEAA